MESDLRAVRERLLERLEDTGSCLTIDADVHATDLSSLPDRLREHLAVNPDYYHGRPISAEDIIAEMNMSGVDMALCWQNPASTQYTNDPAENFETLLKANRYILRSAARYPDRIIPAGWADPKGLGPDLALKLVDILTMEFGFAIVKMNPAQNRFQIDSEEVLAVLDRIVANGATPAFHFGADTSFTPAEGLERLARRHPGQSIIAVHMGGGGAGYIEAESLYKKSRELGLRMPDLKFVLSARRDAHSESDLISYQLAGPPYSGNLLCGSDAPYGRMSWNFGGYRAMFSTLMDGALHTDARLRANPALFTEESVRGYLGGNLGRLAATSWRRLLGECDSALVDEP